MKRSVLVGVLYFVGSVMLLMSIFTGVTRAAETYHCNNVTERTSADFEGIMVDRWCKEFVGAPASKVAELRQSCLNPSTGIGQWAKGACDKEWIAACSVKSIGPAALKAPFTQYTYQPTGGNITTKEVIEVARQQCQIMSFGSGKFMELPEGKTKSKVVSQVDPQEKKMGEDRTVRPAGANDINPAFKDYEYPAADFDGKFSMGNMESVSYFSQDDFSKVVDFYKQKFAGTPIQSGTITNFSKNNPDGSHQSATISQVGNRTQIILK